MDKRKQRGDQNVLARKSNKNQVKNATNVDEERWMKKKSWNESLAISKEFQISDQQVVTRKHHKDNPKNWPRSSKGHNHKDTNVEIGKEIGIQLKRVINHQQGISNQWSAGSD